MSQKAREKASNRLTTGYFLTDGRLETTLVFHYQVELTHFAAFELLYTREGRQLLKSYHEPYLEMATRHNLTYILETPTWRANPDWVFKLGYPADELATVNRHAVQFLRELQYATNNNKILISGCVGPRRDQYHADHIMSAEEASWYHGEQIRSFALADVDVVSAMTMNYSDEAIGVVRATRSVGVPVVISFTLGADGNLPSGESLVDAIAEVDRATENYTHYFMINCTQLEHFHPVLQRAGEWKNRLRGIRANASLEDPGGSIPSDEGNTSAPAQVLLEIQKRLPRLQIIGGCGGADHSYLEEACRRIRYQ